MVMTTIQLRALITNYAVLVKDQRIKDAEVLYEYNTKVSILLRLSHIPC
jgi:hypothetical protein